MHFHFDFSAGQILWTLTFAAELVLLIVLLGRDRARRFPWFTASILLTALLELVAQLLFGRMPRMLVQEIFLTIAVATVLVSLMVIVELARRSFAGASWLAWLIAAPVVLAIAGAVLGWWGPWPAWKTIAAGSRWETAALFEDKCSLFGYLLAVELGILVLLLGRRFHAGWRSHAQQIVIGLSTAGLSQIALRALWQNIATHATIHTRDQYEHAMALRDRLYHANNVVYICVLIWWIAWLWTDQPGEQKSEIGSQRSEKGDEGTQEPVSAP